MSKIACNVHTCVHNIHSGCSLPSVSVGGEAAKKSCQTKCDSFAEKNGGLCDSYLFSNCTDSDISCKAEKCFYNDSGFCSALHIDVCGVGACDCEQTECETFVKK